METTRGQQVLLLKTKSYPTDPYDIFFRSQGADPTFVPVLEHRHVNVDTIRNLILAGRIDGFATTTQVGAEYGGIIITSQRAVEALGAVLHSLKEMIQPITTRSPIYVVGPATERAVIDLGFSPPNVHGAHCGNGQALAEFMLTHYKSSKKLLFLVGEIRRDVIPKTMKAGGIIVEEIVIYDTQVVNSFGEDFARVLQLGDAEEGSSEQATRWVVIFSPTGSDTAMEKLGRGLQCDGISGVQCTKRKTYVATIGPTTASHLRDVLGVEPDVVADTPSPQGLWSGLERFLEAAKH